MDIPDERFAPEPKPRGWWSRNWKWFVPIVIVLPLCACGGGCAGLGYFFFWGVEVLKSAEPYKMAFDQVRQDRAVIQRLGEPIEDATWVPSGNIHIEDGRGEASLDFDVSGPKGVAHVRAESRRVDSQWGVVLLEVTFDDGKKMILNAPKAEKELDEAPPFVPPGRK
ncbi:MAG: cytochrome c oxidase assembly factor Coa1 family protein [Pirellulales bacterium]